MRLLICGDRNYNDIKKILNVVRHIKSRQNVEVVIDGTARGADELGNWAARWEGLPEKRYPAQWNLHGKAAGPIRNRLMLSDGRPDLVVAFHSNISESRGTLDMLRVCRRAGIAFMLIK